MGGTALRHITLVRLAQLASELLRRCDLISRTHRSLSERHNVRNVASDYLRSQEISLGHGGGLAKDSAVISSVSTGRRQH